MKTYNTVDIFGSTYITTANSIAVGIHRSNAFCAALTWTDITPAAAVFTAEVTDICTLANHGFTTGLKVRVSSATTLPGGLSASTDYFVIVGTANTFALATSLANALAGTIINITNAGTGEHTITPTAVAGASVKLQASVDNVNWFDIANKSSNITASGSALHEVNDVSYHFTRAVFTCTAGQVQISGKIASKE